MCCLTSMNRRGPTTTCCPASSAICCADSTVASNRARNSNAPPSCPATRASASCCWPRRATAPDAYTPAPLPPAGEGGAQRRVRVWLFVRQLACQIRNDLTHPHPNPSPRSEEHTSELQSLMRISYAVFCLKKKNTITKNTPHQIQPDIQ